MKVRVRFSKNGPARFLGHLDVMRYFQKALRRSGTPCAYSGGFSPHMIMSFAEPLGLGVASEGEYFDVELEYTDPFERDPSSSFPDPPSSAALMESWNRVMVEGFRVLSIRRIGAGRRGNAMAILAAASYTVTFTFDDPSRLAMLCGEFMAMSEVNVLKETKSGTKNVNIRPLVYDLHTLESEDGRGCLSMLLAAGSEANLKPLPVVRALLKDEAETYADTDLQICRTDMFARDDRGGLISLGDTGEEIP